MSQSTMQFDHQGAFIKVERAPGDLLQVELQFRTLKPDVVLVYSETLSESDAQTGYIQVRLSRLLMGSHCIKSSLICHSQVCPNLLQHTQKTVSY